jgi:hypothetical protein
MNLGFIMESGAASTPNLYYGITAVLATISSFVVKMTIEPLLNLSTKDLSYLILSLNTSTI